ncbi:hypothetical protein Cgig2_000219 [Carnegiea gigantea]|uniref:Ubiquitin-like protease family profile domain-containing protein n=1 Tax=Carnegiea gigantea TaxID=171969 RepID=A0A9Q1JQS5_9CARY|nr:hypothetical protein Cgig2_000219 [Carnegiea gigantea]
MRKVQVLGTVLKDKGAQARMNFIENLVVKVSSDIISLTSAVKENGDTLKMLNANVNRLMKHMVDNETTKLNKHMTDTCTTTYIAHPLKSSETKHVGDLNFLHKQDKKVNFNKVYIPMNDRAVHWFLIVVDLECRRVALLNLLPLNKSNNYRQKLGKDLYYLVLQLQDCDEVEIEPEYTFPQLIVDTLNDEKQKGY